MIYSRTLNYFILFYFIFYFYFLNLVPACHRTFLFICSLSTAGAFAKKKKAVKGGTHTLLSTGITAPSKKKHVEYFGGDSTVTNAGDEDEDEEVVEEEGEESVVGGESNEEEQE
jgi:hypothetical protein